jgi:hypothetical protein
MHIGNNKALANVTIINVKWYNMIAKHKVKIVNM